MPEQLPANYIRIDFKANPDLKSVFADKSAGDKCTLEVTFQLDTLNAEAVTGSIEKVASDDYENPDGGDEITADAAKPLMVTMIAGKGGAKKSEDKYASEPG